MMIAFLSVGKRLRVIVFFCCVCVCVCVCFYSSFFSALLFVPSWNVSKGRSKVCRRNGVGPQRRIGVGGPKLVHASVCVRACV